jgi:SPP1 gp7 family putative phage head morphogenesis protein
MPTDPTGRIVNNAVQTNRYANGLARDIADRVDEAGRLMQELLLRRDPTDVKGANRRRRIAALNNDAAAILDDLYADLRKTSTGSFVDLAEVQEAFATRQLTAVGVELGGRRLSRQFWRSIVVTEPIQGAMLNDWWRRQSANTKFQFRRQVQIGMANQETTGDLVRRVRGRSIGRGRFKGGVVSYQSAATRQATALVRTAVNQIASKAHLETYRQHDDVTKEYEYVATLDDRVTMRCASLDGKRFKYGEGPMPPQHWNCRSTIVPIVDWEGLGIETPKPGQRASAGGPVSAKTDYAGWLKDQPQGVQDRVLGKTRAEMFRSGKVTLGQMVRSDNSVLTLDELKARI